ncbi:MAG: insulinase family protein [Calditrichaeota bacterium]|nr:insulinase family protein [Calditrichota bacterium]
MMKQKSLFALLIIIALSLCLLSSSTLAQNFDAMKKKVSEYTLDNGMKFIVMERHDAPVVSFHVYANVGSANEVNGITGISHLLEHMAFKGTKIIGTKDYNAEKKIFGQMDKLYDEIIRVKYGLNPDSVKLAALNTKFESLQNEAKQYVVNNELFDLFMQQGDAGINAYTSNDATQYINSLPSNRLEFWMSVTSDRFLNPVFREFYKEKNVVMEERRLSLETQPTGRLMEDFLAVAFKAHPYHHSVVGYMSDLKKITRQDVANYFHEYYQAGNLTVGIVGDVKAKEVFKLAKIYFGRLPRGPEPRPVRTVEPEQWGERIAKVSAQSQPILLVGYHRPAETDPDDAALSALANIIGQGRSSRLWESLVKDKKIAIQTGTFNGFPGTKFPNLIAFVAVPSKNHTSDECLDLIEKEIEGIKTEPVTAEELTKFKQSTKKSVIDGMKANASIASTLTYFEVVHGDWQKAFEQIAAIEKVTAEDIMRVAKKYLVTKNRTIGEIVPENEAE